MYNGLLEVVDEVPTRRINATNSSLRQIDADPTENIRVPGAEFDSNGNLWVLNSIQEQALHVRSPDGSWQPIDVSRAIPSIDNDPGPTSIVVTENDLILFGTINNGLVGYNPRDENFGQLTVGSGRGNLLTNYVTAITEDLDGQIWIGHQLGLRRIFNASGLFGATPVDSRPIVIEDNNGILRELLEDQFILDIEVDGNNNKWVGTADGGVFQFSPDGQETLLHFTKSNSPLPSNEVRDITIDGDRGLIYFATSQGLVAFKGDISSSPAPDLEGAHVFPNPLRPGMPNKLTINGLTQRARVKITDVEGNLVYEEVSNGGSIQWDTRTFNGDLVRSGVYLIFMSTEDAVETNITKALIVR
jgi:hypothetical protein